MRKDWNIQYKKLALEHAEQTDRDEVDLNGKPEVWEHFYNYDRPHGAFQGRTPYEMLRSLLR